MVVRMVTLHSVVPRVEISVFLSQVLVQEVVQSINDFSTGNADAGVRGVYIDTPGERARDDLDLG